MTLCFQLPVCIRAHGSAPALTGLLSVLYLPLFLPLILPLILPLCLAGCGGPASDEVTPSPGPVNPGTIEEIMTEDVFGQKLDSGDLFLLEPFQQVPPATGQICMAIGVIEPTGASPSGLYHYDADLLPVYTAEVYYNAEKDFYYGNYFEFDFSQNPGVWIKTGSYEYRPNLEGVEVYQLQPLYSPTQAYYELATGDVELNLTGLEPCQRFETNPVANPHGVLP